MFDDSSTSLNSPSGANHVHCFHPVFHPDVDRTLLLDHPLHAVIYPSDLFWQCQTMDGSFDPLDDWHMSNFDGVGIPLLDAACWQLQDGQNAGAVVTQISVYEAITSLDLSEAQASHIAAAQGWFDPETGTHPQDIGKLLASWGISIHQTYDATLEDIAIALEQGNKALVTLDIHKIWQPPIDPVTDQPIELVNNGHTVWVTGIDQSLDGSIHLILNDSGTPNGCMMIVDAQDFLDIWQDYGNFLVVADGRK